VPIDCQTEPVNDPVREAVTDLLLPYFIDPAGGDRALARAMVGDQIASYRPRSSADLLRVSRIIALRMSAVGNLRLSMGTHQDIQSCWRRAATLSKQADIIALAMTEG